MTIALISDIHGNLEALEAVLEDIASKKADRIYCLGDVLGYGSDPSACLHLASQHCSTILMGNHEYAVLGHVEAESMNDAAQESIAWTASQLSDRELSIITDLEFTAEVENCLLVHASPHEPEQWHYILTRAEAARAFDACSNRLCFFGHTHVPMIFARGADGKLRSKLGHDFDPDEESRYLVNVGSVGQPRDDDPRAAYLIYDATEETVTYHRVAYDIRKTQAKMSDAKLPQTLIERLEFGR